MWLKEIEKERKTKRGSITMTMGVLVNRMTMGVLVNREKTLMELDWEEEYRS